MAEPETPPLDAKNKLPDQERAAPERRLPEEGKHQEYRAEAQRRAQSWIEDNPVAALLAGFAAGVFIGVLMRS